MDTWLDRFFEDAMENNYDDRDVVQMLKDKGFELNDLKSYRYDTYRWAKQYW